MLNFDATTLLQAPVVVGKIKFARRSGVPKHKGGRPERQLRCGNERLNAKEAIAAVAVVELLQLTMSRTAARDGGSGSDACCGDQQ